MWGGRVLCNQAPNETALSFPARIRQLESRDRWYLTSPHTHSTLCTVGGEPASALGGKRQEPDSGFLQLKGGAWSEWWAGGLANIRNEGDCPAPEIVWFTTSIISTSSSHKLKILSPWRKHVTRGVWLVLSLSLVVAMVVRGTHLGALSVHALKMQISMPAGRGVIDWISPSDRGPWSDGVHRCYTLNWTCYLHLLGRVRCLPKKEEIRKCDFFYPLSADQRELVVYWDLR